MNKNNNPHHDWDKLFEQLPLDTNPDDSHREKLKQQSLEAFDAANERAAATIESPDPTAQVSPNRNPVSGIKKIGRVLMNYKTHYWTTAAILIGCIFWMTQDSKQAVAFENFVERLRECTTYRYVMEMGVDDTKSEAKVMYLAPGKHRFERDDTVISIDGNTKKALTLDRKALTAQIADLGDTVDYLSGDSNVIEALKDGFLDFTDDPDRKVKDLGQRIVDGKAVRGLQTDSKWGLRQSEKSSVDDEDMISRVSFWEDPATGFPVLIQVEMVVMGKVESVMTIKDFEFDVELDESLFSMDVPDGYTIEAAEEVSMFDEEETEFIASLKKLSTSLGKFPPSFDSKQMDLLLAEYAKREGLNIEGENGVERYMTETMDLMIPLASFPNSMLPSADAHYKPEGVAVGDKSRAIFWYKPFDKKEYRVIYGDFSVKVQKSPPRDE